MSWFGRRKKQNKRISMIAAAVVKRGPAEPPLEAYIINISYGGIAIYAREALWGRVQVVINLGIATGKRTAETISGEVTWRRPVGASYAVGVAFDGLNEQEHGTLINFLDKAMNSGKSVSDPLQFMKSLRLH